MTNGGPGGLGRGSPAIGTIDRQREPRAGEQRGAGRDTRRLLVCGLAAGPLFAAVAAVQVVARDGFDLTEHPISLLSLGDRGWVQIANFVVTGLLFIAFAIGVRRTLRTGRASVWGPLLFVGYGAGLIVAGVFTADPSQGFPPGAPQGTPDDLSMHATLHGLGFVVAMVSVSASCFVFARWFASAGRRRAATWSILTSLGAVLLAGFPGQEGASIRYALATVVVSTWTTWLAFQLASLRPVIVRDDRPPPGAN